MGREKSLWFFVLAAILLATTPALAGLGNPHPLTRPRHITKVADWSCEIHHSPYIAMGDNRAMVVSSGCHVNSVG